MKLALIAFTAQGAALAAALRQRLTAAGHLCQTYARPQHCLAELLPWEGGLGDWAARWWPVCQGLIFIGACGIAVRAIAPLVRDKLADPAVVVVDEGGHFAISLLSGHVGGANALTEEVAQAVGATPVISTATDVNRLFAVDSWAVRQNVAILDRLAAKAVSAALLHGEPVGWVSDWPLAEPLPPGIYAEQERPAQVGISLSWRQDHLPFATTLRLAPRLVVLGIGCRKGIATERIAAAVDQALAEWQIAPQGVQKVCSIDLKAQEPGLLAFCRQRGWPLECFSGEQLRQAQGEFTPSPFVKSVTGVENVCERAAVWGSGQGRLLFPKTSRAGVTVAAAVMDWRVHFGY